MCEAAAPVEPIDPKEVAIRDFLKVAPVFHPFVFDSTNFPAVSLVPDKAVRAFVGDYTVRTTFYDPKLNLVTVPKKPGPYAAVVEIQAKNGRTTRRLVTVYRLARPMAPSETFTESNFSQLAKASDLPSSEFGRQFGIVTNTVRGRGWSEVATDPRAARLLAGLSLSPHGGSPIRKNSDAFAMERQWWVDLKRRLDGTDQMFTQKVKAPRRLAGKPAPVVREGTLAEAGMKSDTATKIDAALQAWAADTDQAFAVCVVRHGVIVLHHAYGERDGHPMTLTNKSWMASVTKTMSACQMMVLVDQGLARLDDPIEKYLPALRGVEVGKPITLRHLYTHTSGLDKWPAWSDESADVENQLADCYPFVQVGQVWAYNGQGYTTGGKIIESISGEAMPLFYLKHFLEPLGCSNTDVIATHADAMTTPLDMARFGQMLLNRGSYGRIQFFRPETFEQMLPKKLTDVLGPDVAKTFGIGLDGQPGSGKFGHGTASAATFSIDTKQDLVVIMCRNSIGKNYDKYNGKFWKAIQDGMEK
ncbi:MAG: Beta-lactamase [Verrucomicrobiales bacterium]|nr:Beta-lactamase [Verrucomicrobiales bacterium]